jgi:acyl-[acyl-carrier-protein]-phospholipid O-acyltransferase / long-chain-fatty-acid--[acyl-carrier-protein] ligase
VQNPPEYDEVNSSDTTMTRARRPREARSDTPAGAIERPLTLPWRLLQRLLQVILWVLVHTVYRIRVEGLENLPKEGGALLTPDHWTFVDGFVIYFSLPRHVRFVVYANYIRAWWARWFAHVAEMIPIEPGKRSMVESVRSARNVLLSGQVCCIFPEGEVTHTGETGAFQPGFLKILKGAHVPVVPVHLDGLWGSIFGYKGGKVFWKWPRGWFDPVILRIGRPILHPSSADEVREAVLALRNGK